jgi:hypothetical protein
MKHKLLVSVCFHYYEEGLKYLKRVIDELYSYNKDEVDVEIIVDTNSLESRAKIWDIYPNIDVCVYDWLKHPYGLTWMHRRHFKSKIDLYDVFMYIEYDMKLPYQNYKNYLENFELLWPDGVPALFRIEEKDGSLYNTEVSETQIYSKSNIKHIGNKQFIHSLRHPLPYHAMWICPSKYLKEIMPPDFVRIERSREKAASFLIWEMLKNGHIEIEKERVSPKTFVYHLPNNYSHDPTSSYGKITIDNAFKFINE